MVTNVIPRTQNSTRIGVSVSDRIFDIVNTILLLIVFASIAYPLIYVVSASFSDSYAVISGQVRLLPVRPTLMGYKTIFKDPEIIRGFLNSVYVMVIGTAINVVMTVMAAYPLSVKQFYGRNIFMGIFTFTMFFGGGLIPTFLLIKNLGLYNSYFAILLPGAVNVYNVIVARTFFQSSIPHELNEAAEIDGCSDIRFLMQIVLPLSAPILAVLTLMFAVGHWNSYFGPMIYLSDKKKFTLQIILRNILIKNQNSDAMMQDAATLARQQGLADLLKYSLIVISSLPMLILYPFIQKHFVKGIMIGSLKG